ncbi:MAG: N-acetyltransferase [Candidatus Bathyarchaeia archaeon]
MSCKFCDNPAIYKCAVCGKLLCGAHTKIRTICTFCLRKTTLKYTVIKAKTKEEKNKIRQFVERFWQEQEQLTFDKKFLVAELPAYVAKVKGQTVGFVAFAEIEDAVLIVALGVLPQYQNLNIGKSLVEKVEEEAKRLCKKKLLVSTSNDDLPALAFYQSIGFQIYEIKQNVIAEKHGMVLKGIGGLPIRDELRLQKQIL